MKKGPQSEYVACSANVTASRLYLLWCHVENGTWLYAGASQVLEVIDEPGDAKVGNFDESHSCCEGRIIYGVVQKDV